MSLKNSFSNDQLKFTTTQLRPEKPSQPNGQSYIHSQLQEVERVDQHNQELIKLQSMIKN